jgi:prepilin-type N-terminal cleavage/methylation domain-containing protein
MKRRAFTLLEILVAISIIGILALAIMPVSMDLISSMKLSSSARTIMSDLRMAQQRSMTLSTDVICDFRAKSIMGDPARYYIKRYDPAKKVFMEIKTVKLERSFNFKEDVVIKFSRTGFPAVGGSGTVTVKDFGERTKKVVVSSTGRVRME